MGDQKFQMIEECVYKYEARKTPQGDLLVEIRAPARFADLWLLKLNELIATSDEIEQLSPDEPR